MTSFYISNGSSFTNVPVALTGITEDHGCVRATTNDCWQNDTPENKASSYQSLIGTHTDSGTWYNIISCRHRNNTGDGPNYGMYIQTPLTSYGNLMWNNQVNKTWGTKRTIYDSGNPEMIVSSSEPVNSGCKLWIQQ